MYRKATLGDCRQIYNLICELETETLPFENFSAIFNRQFYLDCYYCLVCEEKNNIVAVLNLRFEEQLHHSARVAEILEFFVAESYRSNGVGAEMFEMACSIAKSAGCIQMEAACNQKRKNSHRFYQRQGMENQHFKFSKML